MSDIWAACGSRAQAVELAGEVLRMVESQAQLATQRLVRNLAEHDLLELLLEHSKPARPTTTAALDYLLATPFRYPPLPHGSRFGRRHEPGLFYASRTLPTVLAEAAYYRFVFWQGMATPPPRMLRTQQTLFGARIQAARAFRLHEPPFDSYDAELASPANYSASQTLGTALRAAGAEAIEYRSVRDAHGGLNVGLYTPAAFAGPAPTFREEWFCETTADRVSFRARVTAGVHALPLSQFTMDGVLPMPAV